MEYRDGIPVDWHIGKNHGVATSSYDGQIKVTFYVFDTSLILKSLIPELLFGNEAAYTPTYVRGANTDAVFQAQPTNSVTYEERLNSSMGSSRDELYLGSWVNIGGAPGPANTSGVAKSDTVKI